MKHILQSREGDTMNGRTTWYLKIYDDETGEIKEITEFEDDVNL